MSTSEWQKIITNSIVTNNLFYFKMVHLCTRLQNSLTPEIKWPLIGFQWDSFTVCETGDAYSNREMTPVLCYLLGMINLENTYVSIFIYALIALFS